MNKKLLVFALLFVLLSVSVVIASMRRLDYPLTPEQIERQRDMLISILLFLFISVCIIFGDWVYHIKEEKSSDYLLHGVLGFLMAIMMSIGLLIAYYIALIILVFIFHKFLETLGSISAIIIIYGLFILLAGGLCFFEFKYYKKTGKLYWRYTLIFNILLIIYILFFSSNIFGSFGPIYGYY